MKNGIFSLAFFLSLILTSSVTFSQENEKPFTHTLQINAGYRGLVNTSDIGGLNPSWYNWSGNDCLNLIPSYELGYKNKFFAKLRYANYYYSRRLSIRYNEVYYVDGTEYPDYFYPDLIYSIVENIDRVDVLSVVFSYNFLNKSKRNHLKLGFDIGYGLETSIKGLDYGVNWREKMDFATYKNLLNLGIELSYKHYLNKHFAIGVETGFGYLVCKGYCENPANLMLNCSYTF